MVASTPHDRTRRKVAIVYLITWCYSHLQRLCSCSDVFPSRINQIMNRYSHQLLACMASALLVFAVACSGSDGATGPAGPRGNDGKPGMQGPPGPEGPQGNANAWIYSFGAHDFGADAAWIGSFSGLTEEEATQSLWLVYLVDNGGQVFHMPGFTSNSVNAYSVSHAWLTTDWAGLPDERLQIVVQLRSGYPGEPVAGIRVIRIAAMAVSGSVSGAVLRLPVGLDAGDYNAVLEYVSH